MLKFWIPFALTAAISACSSASDSQLDAANRPQAYQTICKIGETCSLNRETLVAFGANGKFVYQTLNGSFLCTVETFGSDPIPAKKVKECSIPMVRDAAPMPPSTPTPTPNPTPPPTNDNSECRAGATIRDKTVDCGGKTIGLSCDADSESQPPVLTLINASVKNLRIAANGGSDGIHCKGGDCTLENVVWEDICEDAATHKSEGGTLTIIGGSAYNDATGPGGKPDKIFQHNSKNSTTIVTGGFTVKGEHGKLWRSCGDCSNNGGPRRLVIDDVIIEGTITAGVAGANRNYGDQVQIRRLGIKNYQAGKTKICEEYTGVNKGQGSSSKLGEFFNSPTCDVSPSDIFGYP
jgi:Pectate lyase